MIDLDIKYDEAKLEALAKGLVAMPRQLRFARARALRKTSRYVRTQVKREVAKKLRFPQKAISDRFFLSRVFPSSEEATLWIGTWNVSPYAIGNPRQDKMGVKVGRGRSYPGAFLGNVYGGNESVWIRKRSRYYSAELYPTRSRKNSGILPPELRHRFPVIKAAVKIDEILKAVVQRDEAEIGAIFKKNLLHEINYEVNVRGKFKR